MRSAVGGFRLCRNIVLPLRAGETRVADQYRPRTPSTTLDAEGAARWSDKKARGRRVQTLAYPPGTARRSEPIDAVSVDDRQARQRVTSASACSH